MWISVRERFGGEWNGSIKIGEEMPTLNDVASMLYLSPQTLRRRLAAEGKSYQGVKDALRRDAAIHLLLNPELTLEDVAHL